MSFVKSLFHKTKQKPKRLVIGVVCIDAKAYESFLDLHTLPSQRSKYHQISTEKDARGVRLDTWIITGPWFEEMPSLILYVRSFSGASFNE